MDGVGGRGEGRLGKEREIKKIYRRNTWPKWRGAISSFNTFSTSVTTCKLKQITSVPCFSFFICKFGVMLLILLPGDLAHLCRNSCSTLSSERRNSNPYEGN